MNFITLSVLWKKEIKQQIMGTIIRKVFTYLILPVCIAGLVYLNVESIKEPVVFKKHREYRESVAIQRLKDIRDLQVAFKNVHAHYASTVDSLKWFYNEGKMKIVLQVGSKDDSLAMANTKKYTQKYRNLKKDQLNKKLHELYLAGEQNLVFEVTSEIPVKDTLFSHRPDFCVDSLAFIPFSGDSVIMESTIKKVSGVNVPLFEAKMPYKSLLRGLDNQLRINLDAEQEDKGHYKGLMVGSIDAPNNNAGNWE